MALQPATLSKIHIARQQLGMDDTTYRAILARVCGAHSAKDLNNQQAASLLDEFKRLGWKPKASSKTKGKPHNVSTLPKQISKIEALLAELGLPWAYADAIGRQMFKISRIAWLRKPAQLDAIIAALHAEHEKRQLLAKVEQLCTQLGLEKPEQMAGMQELPEDWTRQRPVLKALITALSTAIEARGIH